MLASWLTAAALAGTLDVSDRSELRLRYPGFVANTPALDLETDPVAKLTLAERRYSFMLEYAPQIVGWDVADAGFSPSFLNQGTARAETTFRHLRLSLNETGGYGTVSFASLALTPGPNGAPANVPVFPAGSTFTYESSATTLEARWTPRLWTFIARAGYQLAGGATADSRLTMPYQSGPLGALSADYAVTRLDHVVTSATASYASFSTGIDSAIVELDEGWRHSLDRTTSLLVRAGASEAGTRGVSSEDTLEAPGAPFHYETDPVAETTVRHEFLGIRDTGDLTLGVTLGPTVNPLIGIVDERVQGTAAGHYQHGALALRAQLTLSESVPPSRLYGIRVFYTELAASYRVVHGVTVEIGQRTLWQDPTADATTLADAPSNALYVPAPLHQEVGFIALILKADPIRF